MRHGWRVGKNWSKGLTKATDARVARAAAGHVGLRYVRRTPLREHKGRSRGYYRGSPLVWNAQLAYALGLAATDGCLVSDGRHVAIASEDREQVETFLRCVGRPGAHISKDKDKDYFRAQLGDVELYRFLADAGLTPRKSLTLGSLSFPTEFFWDVIRGLMDGDGSVQCYVHQPIKAKYPLLTYERLNVLFHTASVAHANWLRDQLSRRRIRSALLVEDPPSRKRTSNNPMYRVKLSKYAAIKVLSAIYADPDAPRLLRKWLVWNDFFVRHSNAEAAKLVRRAGAAGRSYAAVSRTAGLHAHEGSNPSSGTDSALQELHRLARELRISDHDLPLIPYRVLAGLERQHARAGLASDERRRCDVPR